MRQQGEEKPTRQQGKEKPPRQQDKGGDMETFEKAKEYLTRPQRIIEANKKDAEKILQLESSLIGRGVRYDTDRVQTSPKDNMSEVVSEIVTIEKNIYERNLLRANIISEIYRKLNSLDNPRHSQILHRYYLMNRTFSDIAEEMNLSAKWVSKLHVDALKALAETL